MEILTLLVFVTLFFSIAGLKRFPQITTSDKPYWTHNFMSRSSHTTLRNICWPALAVCFILTSINAFYLSNDRSSEHISVSSYQWEYLGQYKVNKNNGRSIDYYFASPEGVRPINDLNGKVDSVGSPVYAYKGYSETLLPIDNIILKKPVYYYASEPDDYLLMVNRSVDPVKVER